MVYQEVKQYIEECEEVGSGVIIWCNEGDFAHENKEEKIPGGFINPFGYFVVGLTPGGNGIVLSSKKEGVFFAGHTWYFNKDFINYLDIGKTGDWLEAEYNEENVHKTIYPLANSRAEFIKELKVGTLEDRVLEID